MSLFPIFLARGLLPRSSNLLPGRTEDGNTLNNILTGSAYRCLALSVYNALDQFISMNVLFVVPTVCFTPNVISNNSY